MTGPESGSEHFRAAKRDAATRPGRVDFISMVWMINDILNLARADRGLLRPAHERVDLAAEIDALFEFFDAWAEEQGIMVGPVRYDRWHGDP